MSALSECARQKCPTPPAASQVCLLIITHHVKPNFARRPSLAKVSPGFSRLQSKPMRTLPCLDGQNPVAEAETPLAEQTHSRIQPSIKRSCQVQMHTLDMLKLRGRIATFSPAYGDTCWKLTLVPDRSRDCSVVRLPKCITFSSEAASQLLRSSNSRPVRWDREVAMLPSTK